MAAKKKSVKDFKGKIIHFKVNPSDYRGILLKAKQFADGNMSEWLRYVGVHAKPKSKIVKK